MERKTAASLAERLSEFLSRLPPSLAEKLALGIEREKLRGTGGLPYDLILSSIRPVLAAAPVAERVGIANPLRRFCAPFEDFLVDEPSPASRAKQIRRASIVTVWSWLETDLMPDTLPDIARRLVEQTLADDTDGQNATLAVMHATCSAAIHSAIEATRRDTIERRKLERRLGGEHVVDDALEMANALSVATYMIAVQRNLPKHIGEFDEGLVAEVSEVYEEARHSSMEHGIYVPYVVMARLSEPWQILRLARKLAGYGNDAAVSRSGLAGLGEIFLAELDDIADALSNRRPGSLDLGAMQEQTTRFAKISQGFIREIDIRRCSEWGHRILAARARLSTAIAEEMSRFEHDVVRALPLHQIGSYGRNGPRRPDVTGMPDADRVERAAACLRFLTGVAHAAESIGAQAHCKIVLQQIETYLEAYEDALIEELRRSKAVERANALAFLDVVVGFREAMGAIEMAQTLRRRGQVASAAQAS